MAFQPGIRMIAIYTRVSSRKQDTRSQLSDLKRWIAAHADEQTVRWYRDKASGKTMERPGWQRLQVHSQRDAFRPSVPNVLRKSSL